MAPQNLHQVFLFISSFSTEDCSTESLAYTISVSIGTPYLFWLNPPIIITLLRGVISPLFLLLIQLEDWQELARLLSIFICKSQLIESSSLIFIVIILLWSPMPTRDKLNVTINRPPKSSSSSGSSGSSEEENSNQFLNSRNNDSEGHSIALQAINQPAAPKNTPRRQNKVESVRSGVQNQNLSKISSTHNPKVPPIPQQKIDLRGRIQKKNVAKPNSFQFMSPQPQERQQPQPKNKSSMMNAQSKRQQESYQSIEEEKIQQINKNRQKLNSSIHEMKGSYQQLQLQQKQTKKPHKRKYESPFGIPQSPEKQRQILEFLHKKHREKKDRKKKLVNIALKEEHKKTLEERELQQLKQRQKKRRLKELKQYSKFQSKHEEWREEFMEKQKQAEEVVKKYEGKVGYHIKALKGEEDRKKRERQEELKALNERKEMFKSIDENQLMEHQRWHADKVDQLNYERLQIREEELQRISDENSKNDLYHGNSHTIVEEQQMERRKKKRQPKEKARRIKEYRQYIKKNFLPRTYQHRSLQPPQITNRSNSHREVRRYRYYKGMAVGEVREELPLPKTDREVKKIGDNYLDYVRTLPKKVDSTIQEELQLDPEDIEILEKKFNGISRVKRSIHPIYDDSLKKKIAIEVAKNAKRDELQMMVMQLQATDQRLKNKQTLLNHNVYGNVKNVQGQQKQINQGFVENIQRKLALLAQL